MATQFLGFNCLTYNRFPEGDELLLGQTDVNSANSAIINFAMVAGVGYDYTKQIQLTFDEILAQEQAVLQGQSLFPIKFNKMNICRTVDGGATENGYIYILSTQFIPA